MKRLLPALLLSLVFAGPASAAAYKIDANHTQVHFHYSHLGFSNLSGRFMEVTGSFDFDAANPEKSSIQVQLPIASLSTGVTKLDTHLASADFFDAAQFPTASFSSTKVSTAGPGKLSVAGDLTIHGVTRPVLMDVTINQSGPHPMRKLPTVGLDASTVIKRSEFGIGRMVPAVPDEVKLTISMEASEPKPE